MPNYEYHCKSCGHKVEIFQKMKDGPIDKCPECRLSTLQRGPGGGLGLHFKGAGFYINDYDSTPKSESTAKEPSSACCPCGKNACEIS